MKRVLSCLIFLSVSLAFTKIEIEPVAGFHDKRKSLIVICNATLTNERPILIYSYRGKNYTIPSISNNSPYVYVGNLSLTDPDQFRVNVLCLRVDSSDLITSKIYLFGYSPTIALKGDSTPKLNCQDFNFKRVICCMTLNENEIAKMTGLVEEQNGHLKIELFNLQSAEKELKLNNSCFNVSQLASPSLNLSLIISNDLGSQTFNFSFNREQISKPESPNVILEALNKNTLQLIVKMIDFGEFMINATCSAYNPINVVKTFTKVITSRTINVKLDGWVPYSIVSCKMHSRVLFGAGPVGQFSEPSISKLQMPQSEPNCGPIISPAFVEYDFVSNDGYLENVVVYFIDLKMIDQNGIIIHYLWKCEDCFNDKGFLFNVTEKLSNNSRSIRILRAKVNSSITITACTNIGCSNEWSVLHFRKLPVGNLNSRTYLIQNGNNLDLLWYLRNQTFSQMPLNQTGLETQPYVLVCYKTKNYFKNKENNCSSTQLIALDYKLIGQKSLDISDMIPVQFAYIRSLDKFQLSKLIWITCIYQKSTTFEIERTLSGSEFKSYTTHDIECRLSKCNGSLKIKIPLCTTLSSVILNGIQINYNNGKKNSYQQYFLSYDEIQIQLSDLYSNNHYHINISIITSDNRIIFWRIYTIYTGWFAEYKVGLIILAIFVCIILFTLFIYYIHIKTTKKIYKPASNNLQLKRRSINQISHQVGPLTLNNTGFVTQFTNIDNDIHSISDSNSPIIQDTNSTTIYLNTQTFNSNYSSTDCSTDQKSMESQMNNDNYIKRPEIPHMQKHDEIYMHLFLKENKGTNDRILESNGLIQENVEV